MPTFTCGYCHQRIVNGDYSHMDLCAISHGVPRPPSTAEVNKQLEATALKVRKQILARPQLPEAEELTLSISFEIRMQSTEGDLQPVYEAIAAVLERYGADLESVEIFEPVQMKGPLLARPWAS